MARPEEFRCTLDAPEAETLFRRFATLICGEAGHARHAVLIQTQGGPRCLLQNSGRCIESDTPWAMIKMMAEPLLRFDPTVEWVALMPVDDWQMRMDGALAESFADDGSWAQRLADDLLAELPSTQRLVIARP